MHMVLFSGRVCKLFLIFILTPTLSAEALFHDLISIILDGCHFHLRCIFSSKFTDFENFVLFSSHIYMKSFLISPKN